MEYVRIVHPLLISEVDGRPSDLAFKKSSADAGISCVNVKCAVAESDSVCRHIARYYAEPIKGDPIIYWPVPDSPLLKDGKWEHKVGTNGDPCHYNLLNVSRNAACKLIRSQPIGAFVLCDGDSVRTLQLSDIIASRARHAEKDAS